jgi:dihydrolipoamide dehydrogenase
VIGGGPGGYPAAIRAARLGARTALVEKERLGGTCLNWGCIPTKTLIAGSDLFAHMAHAESMGIRATGVAFDYAQMAKRKDEVVAQLRGGISQLLKANKVALFEGTASFESRNRISIVGAQGRNAVETASTIIATGSESGVPGFLPKSDRVMESRGFLELTKLPASLLVLGGGVIGCEFACMAAQLGVKVTIVELLEDILLIVDADVRKELRRHMETALGIRVLTGKALADVQAGADKVTGRFGDEVLSAGLLLVAIGRKPVTAGLALANAGLKANDRGFIPVNASCHTAAATVFAVGDVNGGPQLAHAATSQGVTAAENAVRGTRTTVETLIPACIFTSPEIGSVGLTEQDAKAQNRAIATGRFAFAGLGKALASGSATGFVKWVADAKTDQLLGAHAIGSHATELISEAAVAIRAELTVAELGRTVHCHPTLSEAWMEAAHAVHGECIHAAPRRHA